jgi:hypothetical protein
MFTRTRFLSYFVLACLLAVPAFAQTNVTTGSIKGVVADNSNSPLPGVTVTATNTGTGLTRNSFTDADGSYEIILLPPGTYRVDAELAGLGNARKDGVNVALGTTTTVRLALNPQVAETITVVAEAPVVDVSQAGLTTSVTETQIENLPVLGRDFRDLVALTPGVTSTFGDKVSLNGARGYTTDFNIDGAEANSDFFGEQRGGTEAQYTFSQAAIREFQVIRTAYSAEFARGVSGTLNAITKSGTNDLDGEVFYYLRDEDWASDRSTENIDEFFNAKDISQYGFSAGGPVVRDRMHFFANADFSDSSEPFVVQDIRNDTRFLTLTPAVQSAFVTRLETLLGNSLDEEYNYDAEETQKVYLLKFDWNVGTNHHISFRDNYSDYNNFPSESPAARSNQGNEFNKTNSAVVQAESVLTPSLFNQVIVQYGWEDRPIDPLSTAIPATQIQGLSTNYFFGQRDFLPNGTEEKKWQIKEAVTWAGGSHTLKTGFDFVQADLDNFFVRDRSGDYTFASVQDFLDNKPRQFQQGMGPGDGHNQFDVGLYGIFVHDTWKPLEKLTLDFGVRYDWQDMPTPDNNIYTTHPEFVDNFNEDDDNIAPRVGFAYDITGNGRSVVRGGAGMYYQFLPGIIYANPIAQISGIFNNLTLDCRNVTCPTYPNIFTPEQFNAIPAQAARDIALIGPDLEAQESLRTSLGWEQQLGTAYSVGVEGVYSKIDKAQRLVNINAMPTGVVFGNLPEYNITNPNRAYPDFANVRQHVSDSEGDYTSLTVSTRRFALGDSRFSWFAHYTWSEAIDQDSNERSTSTSFSLDPYNPELSEGRADYDVTHKVVASATYELPFGVMVSGIANWRTGQPYTPGVSGFTYGLSSIGVNIPVWVDGNGDIIDLTQANGMNKTQFASFLAAQDARLMERNNENQPDFFQVDMRLSKRFDFAGGYGVEILGEVFNVTNEANRFITGTNTAVFTSTFSNNTYNFTRNANYGRENGLNFSSPPRQYQAAIKLHF